MWGTKKAVKKAAHLAVNWVDKLVLMKAVHSAAPKAGRTAARKELNWVAHLAVSSAALKVGH